MAAGSRLVGSRSDYQTISFCKAPALGSSDILNSVLLPVYFYTYHLILLEILVEKHTQLNNFSYAVKDDKGE